MPARNAKPSKISTTYQLKITLVGISPPIWRRVLVPSTLTISKLHDALQVCMGWTNSHLHQFEKDGRYWGKPETDDYGIELLDERRVPVGQLLQAEGDSLSYLYDLGDKWRHTVYLEKIVPSESPSPVPVCLAGERRCPPEDVGGPSGYEEFLAVIFEPGHEDSERFRQWGGGTFHAEEFNLKAVNDALERMHWPVKRSR